MENININQGIVKLIMSQKLFVKMKQLKMCSIKNQSKVYILKKNNVINKKRFKEAINETQKKNNSDCMYECGNTC